MSQKFLVIVDKPISTKQYSPFICVLLQIIKKKGIRNSDDTRAMVKEKLSQDSDSEIAAMGLRVSLLCPLGKMRIKMPCRAITCTHVQCFDALLYFKLNEKKPTWVCPVCHKPARFSNLEIDGLFNDIIKEVPPTCNEVQFNGDGSWTPIIPEMEDSFEGLSLSSGLFATKRPFSPKKSEPKRREVEVITIDSSDEEEDHNDLREIAAESSSSVLSSESGSESVRITTMTKIMEFCRK